MALCFAAGGLPGFALSPDGAELELFLLPEYSRSFNFSWALGLKGSVETGGFVFGGGISLDRTGEAFGASAHASAEYRIPFFRPVLPLHLKIAWIYKGLPEYDTSVHTLLPLLSLRWNGFGFSLGSTLRFTRFGGDPVLFEPILAWSVRIGLYDSEAVRIWTEFSNMDDFKAENLGVFSWYLRNTIRITQRLGMGSGVEIVFSGNTSRIISVYGMTFKQTLVFTW